MPPQIPNEEHIRKERLEYIRSQKINPFPSICQRKNSIKEAKSSPVETKVNIAGRLILKREMGKLCFAHIKDETNKIQIAISEKELGKEQYQFFLKSIDLGDFIEVEGEIFTTHKGEISVLVKKYAILAKALLPLPEKFHGLSDTELRYRQRYLDLLANEESTQIAKMRSLLVREIRRYFDNRGFIEVETPILQPLYGGALARPFVTHHNALNIDLYLRIAPELYLKKLIIGGFEKVYEIGRCFRNEGIDHNHNPEFTQIEFYWAYANYNDLMNLMEDFLPEMLKALKMPLKLEFSDSKVDFTPPYPRKTMRDLVAEYTDIDIDKCTDQQLLFAKAKNLNMEGIDKKTGYGKLVDEIYKNFVRPKILNPLFVIDHPVELSPLAKSKFDNPRYVERMQLVCMGGNELCNGFSELNDPLEQEKRFQDQEKLRAEGDEESMPFDEDFITALKHGMPPTAGLGMGIDRLVKIIVGASNLKEVILFPTLKPENN